MLGPTCFTYANFEPSSIIYSGVTSQIFHIGKAKSIERYSFHIGMNLSASKVSTLRPSSCVCTHYAKHDMHTGQAALKRLHIANQRKANGNPKHHGNKFSN
jgi:hypothetical protein